MPCRHSRRSTHAAIFAATLHPLEPRTLLTLTQFGVITIPITVHARSAHTVTYDITETIVDEGINRTAHPATLHATATQAASLSLLAGNTLTDGWTHQSTVSINWGDGHTSPGAFSFNHGIAVDVRGTHSFAAPGRYTATIHLANRTVNPFFYFQRSATSWKVTIEVSAHH